MIRKYISLETYTRLMLIIALTLVTAALCKYKFKRNPQNPLNYIELQATYKNYIVTNKKCKDNEYTLSLMNPIFEKNAVHKHTTTTNVKVTENVYYNTYYVGDTIK